MTKVFPPANLSEAVLTYRLPVAADGEALFDLVRESAELDLNSRYFYLLMATYFARTSRVCLLNGTLVGGILGFHPEAKPDTVFIWQILTAANFRRQGIAHGLLDNICQSRKPKFLEATITDGNAASEALFSNWAKDRKAGLTRKPFFSSQDFGLEAHAPEYLFTIGPLS